MAKGKGTKDTKNTKNTEPTESTSGEGTKWVFFLNGGALKQNSSHASWTESETHEQVVAKFKKYYGHTVDFHGVESASPKKHFDAFVKAVGDEDVLDKSAKSEDPYVLFGGASVANLKKALEAATEGKVSKFSGAEKKPTAKKAEKKPAAKAAGKAKKAPEKKKAGSDSDSDSDSDSGSEKDSDNEKNSENEKDSDSDNASDSDSASDASDASSKKKVVTAKKPAGKKAK
jgi:hypothetical protein